MKNIRLIIPLFLAFTLLSSAPIFATSLHAFTPNPDAVSNFDEITEEDTFANDGISKIAGTFKAMAGDVTEFPSAESNEDFHVGNAESAAVATAALKAYGEMGANFSKKISKLFEYRELGDIVDCDEGEEYMTQAGYGIVFNGYEHDSINCRTCFYYCVQNNNVVPNITDYLFGDENCEETCLDEMNIEVDIGFFYFNHGNIVRYHGVGGPYQTGEDPSTGYCGVKSEKSVENNEVHKVYICVDGLHGLGWIKGVLISEEGHHTVDIYGPEVCEGTCAPSGNPGACGYCDIINGPVGPVCPGAEHTYDAQITGICGNPVYSWTVIGNHAGFTANGSSITVEAGPSCDDTYTVSVEISCEDCTTGPLTCEQVVQIGDAESPSIICPIDIAMDCDQSTAPDLTGYPTSTDNCTGPVTNILYRDNIAQGNCPNNYTIERVWTATDECGNESHCMQTITVEDTTPPVISCPTNLTLECEQDIDPLATGQATATDNCTDPVTEIAHQDNTIPGNCPNNYTIERTWTAIDECGNQSQCVQTITVEDSTPPVITIVDPRLAPLGDTTFIQCFGQDPNWALPEFDENSVVATDNCSPDVTLSHTSELMDEGDCERDGNILLYRETWTATDACENSTSISAMVALVDRIAPIIYGVPEDITVNCDEVPDLPTLVYATDECLCACVVMLDESPIQAACQDGQAIIRTWTASDDCGNTTVATQRITLIDNESPQLEMLQPELKGVPNGTIIKYTCNRGQYPNLFYRLSAQSVSAPASCGDAPVVNFSLTNSIDPDNCEFTGFKEQLTAQWTAMDACGNESSLIIYARLIDEEVPVFVGVPEMTCFDDPALLDIYATDNCGVAITHFWDTTIPNPCGNGDAILRTYEAYDNCGNRSTESCILIPNENNPPFMEFINPSLIGMENGDVIEGICDNQKGGYTSFNAEDVVAVGSCSDSVVTTFTEKLIESRDCTTGKMVAVMELQWTSTEMCGNFGVLTLEAHMYDNSGPEFKDFQSSVTIGCLDSLPGYTITDNCGDVTLSMTDSTVAGECELEYVIYRVLTVTDNCGNVTTRSQTIIVGDGKGPIIEGVKEGVCDDLTMPNVTAYDNCTGELVPVTMVQDTMEVNCQSGLLIVRTWTAVGVCGNVTSVRQAINLDDDTPPEIQIPWYSVINYYKDPGRHFEYSSDLERLNLLSLLDENSVEVIDECGLNIIPKFTAKVFPGDCILDGFIERRVYTWVATDICGNATTFSITVHIIDNIPPTLDFIPSDMLVACVDLPPVPVISVDKPAGETMLYYQFIVPGETPGEFIVTRTWVAQDACGNERVVVQNISWIPENTVVCEVFTPDNVDCNSHGVVIDSDVSGGNGPYSYRWDVQGGKCFIQSGQGTPEITIYVGWSQVKVTLQVTDAYGCISMCTNILNCEYGWWRANALTRSSDAELQLKEPYFELSQDGINSVNLTELNYWPNPTDGNVNLSFESEVNHEVQISFTNLLGQVVKREQIEATLGFNVHKTNIDFLEPGSYLMQVTTANERHTKVIVVARQ